MSPDDFRAAALSCPEAHEGGHMGQADFRVGKKIFATLDTAKGLGTLKLDAQQQEAILGALGEAVFTANGSWGARGWTKLILAAGSAEDVAYWMRLAWRNCASRKLQQQHDTQT